MKGLAFFTSCRPIQKRVKWIIYSVSLNREDVRADIFKLHVLALRRQPAPEMFSLLRRFVIASWR
ncbi:hypothetical protein FHX10_003444 [Rhizobium sp. BK591]|nr:hypothetical protein [Rhizobium sp. BK591]